MKKTIAADYELETRTFRERRDAVLARRDGCLSTTSSTILVEGRNDVAFGTVTVKSDDVHVVIHDGVSMTCGGARVRERKLRPDQDEDLLFQGHVSHQLTRRGDTLVLRTCDPQALLLQTFRGASWFPVDERLRLRARAVPLEHPRTRELDYSVSSIKESVVVDYVLVVEIGGVFYSLEPIQEPKRLLVQFRDTTNGEQTSIVGRYLYAPLPQGGVTYLDFNHALTPDSAHNPGEISLVPPERNSVRVRIEAGERNSRSAGVLVLPEVALASG